MLKLYQGNRLEYLSDLMAQILTDEPLSDPFASEQVIVQHPGMGRWLSLQLADELGICANIRFPLPAGFIWELLRHLLPAIPAEDRFAPAIMQWPLFQELGNLQQEPLFAPLQPFLQAQGEQGRFDLAERIARCFDQYLVYRPDWIHQWERGEEALPGDAWQAELWRRLEQRLGPDHWARSLWRLSRAAERGELDSDGLPQRISLFAVSALSPGYLQVLDLLSRWMDIHLFLLNPCEAEWSGIVDAELKGEKELASPGEELYLEVGNPLLSSLGIQGRDFLAALQERDLGTVELFHAAEGKRLLQQLQRDILLLRDGSQDGPVSVPANDDSIRMHSCHGPMRELEVLQDQLLDLFEGYPQLQPDDVLVMTPDMDLYAPYIEAVFGDQANGRRIPFTLADRGPMPGNPLLAAFLALLDLPDSRYPVDQLLSLLEVPAVQRRFGIPEGDLPLLARWIREAGIRWGRDASSRRELGLPETDQNSWRAGLDRLLLGFALPGAGEQMFGDILPVDDAEGSDTALLGALLEFVDSVFDLARRLQGAQSLRVWQDRLFSLLLDFFSPDEEEERPLQQIRDAIATLQRQAGLGGFDGVVSLALMRDRLEALLSGSEEGGGFLAGGVSFCAFTPMRSLPFQVVCLIGMNDGSFPREQRSPGFDLMARHFRFGDRSRRADDRYLFLETLLSARHCLYISYTGQDARENTLLPPSVLVSELLDYLQQAYRFAPDQGIDERLPVKHPLQPFDCRYFGDDDPLFSYSDPMARTAQAAVQRERVALEFITDPLPEPGPEWRSLELGQFCWFLANPTRFLLRERLGIRLDSAHDGPDSRDPFMLDRFESEGLTRHLVESLLSNRPVEQIMQLERASGRLPHGMVGERLFEQARETARPLARQIQEQGLSPGTQSLEFRLPSGPVILSGRLSGLTSAGLHGFSVAPLPASRLLELWVRHLLLNTVCPEGVEPETRWLDAGGLICFAPLDEARFHLDTLLEYYWAGLSRPLHLFPRSSRDFMLQLGRGKPAELAVAKARTTWEGAFNDYPESANPYYQLAFSGQEVLDQAFQTVSEQCFGPLMAARGEG